MDAVVQEGLAGEEGIRRVTNAQSMTVESTWKNCLLSRTMIPLGQCFWIPGLEHTGESWEEYDVGEDDRSVKKVAVGCSPYESSGSRKESFPHGSTFKVIECLILLRV